MLELIFKFGELISEDAFLWFCAIAGSGLFLIQFVLNFFGAFDQSELSEGSDSGDFKWISKQAIIGFLMMFGWVALTSRKEFAFSGPISALFGFAGGLIAMFLTGLIFRSAKRLHSSGSIIKTEDAVGKEAIVYQRIPKGGVGKISVILNDLTCEIDAISDDESEVSSFDRVQVIRKADENTVVVVQLK